MTISTRVRGAALGLSVVLLGGASMLALGPMSGPAQARPIVVAPPQGAPMSFADLIERVSPAVVSVSVVTEVKTAGREELFERFRGLPGFDEFLERRGEGGADEGPEQDQEGRALGSGFFISETGHIVTNNHVVENAREVVVTLKDGQELEANVIGTDPQTDLAVLKVKKAGSYPYVEFSTKSKPRVGDWVVAVGNPFGLGGTATAGIVSADGRQIGGPYTDFLQVDAPINRGNSGGPTFDLFGQVVGVNTAIFSPSGGSVGIGFAIEARAAKSIVDTLIKNGKVVRGWLGVSIQSLSEEAASALDLADNKGAIVSDIVPDSPAAAGGFVRGDIIVAINGEQVEDSRDVTRRVGGLLAGSRNTFKVIRDGKPKTIQVVVKERPASVDQPGPVRGPRNDAPESGGDVKSLGATLAPMTDVQRKALGLTAADKGVVVTSVTLRSELAKAGVAAGDAILSVNKTPVATGAEFAAEVAAAKKAGKKAVVLAVRKGQNTLFLTVDISAE